MIGIGISSLIAYIAIILFINLKLKRKMGEAMLWSTLFLVIVATVFGGLNGGELIVDAISYSAKQEVILAGLIFVFMAYLMEQTGIIGRLVNILNSVLGGLAGGSGYVATIGCALFGMVSGVASANTAAIGSVCIPWMKQTGWGKQNAAGIVAGNSGLGVCFPPSTTMLLVLAFEVVAAELTSSELYVGLMEVGLIVLAMRLALVFFLAKKEGLKPLPKDQRIPLGTALKENASSLLLFVGIAIPLFVTMGATGKFVTARLAATEGAFKSISIIVWIPVLISALVILEGWKYLPHTVKDWIKLSSNCCGRFDDLGGILFGAFAASRVLNKIGLSEELSSVFERLGSYSPILVMLVIIVVVTAMVGPFNSTGTTTALGAASYTALRSIGLSPVASAVIFCNLVSNQGCIPPNSSSIYIACGIAGEKQPVKLFKDMVFLYALPEIAICLLMMFKIIPVL